jgi:hypothetical protein
MLPIKIVLVDTTGTIAPETMVAAAAAVNVQVTRDVPQFWGVSATVSYEPDPGSIPQGTWPVQIVNALSGNEGGYHQTYQSQPYAKVINTPGSDEWTIDASHETVEMLVDPYGSRLQASTAILIEPNGRIADAAGAKFEYLVEACDPCEANELAYSIDGIWVSDFITPSFYDPVVTPNTRYSFTGAVTAPRQILPGGYISWVDPQSGEMLQILWVDPSAPPQYNNLGSPPSTVSLREFVEASTHPIVRRYRRPAAPDLIGRRKAYRANLAAAAHVRARHYI